MGRKGKKKKGGGAEKTQAKTDKKVAKRQQKDEDNIDAILDDMAKQDASKTTVASEACPPPSPRVNATFTPHATKDEIILYGGSFFNGQKVVTYNELYTYSIAKGEFRRLSVPGGPGPRNSHQAVCVDKAGGQLWLFGGEFTAPSQQVKHYKDIWVLHFGANESAMRWEEVGSAIKGGPSPRSGHRMIGYKRKLIVFGGFYDNGDTVSYFDDLYVFDMDEMKWAKVKADSAKPGPSARSGCQFVLHEPSHCAYLYGGFCTKRQKGGVEVGETLTDMWCLDLNAFTWTKVQVKKEAEVRGGEGPSPRSGMGVVLYKHQAVYFGGVSDQDDEDDMKSEFHNDVHVFNIVSKTWSLWDVPASPLPWVKEKKPEPASLSAASAAAPANAVVVGPCPRRSAQLAIKGSQLFVFGGVVEQGDKEVFLNDFYVLDVKKWKDNDKKLKTDSKAAAKKQQQTAGAGAVGASLPAPASASAFAKEEDDDEDAADDSKQAEPLSAAGAGSVGWRMLVALDVGKQMQDWQGDEEDDDKDEKEDGDEKGGEGDEDEEGDEDDEGDEEEEAAPSKTKAADKTSKGKGGSAVDKKPSAKSSSSKDAEAKAASSEQAKGDLTPTKTETLADFFSRTKEHWNAAATAKGPVPSDKELRKAAFELAKAAFESVRSSK